MHQIETGLYERQGRAPSNLARTIPHADSELAEQLFKDPYHLEFLDVGGHAKERSLERALIDKLKDFMLELGKGFAFVGSQVHLQVGERDFFVDLLFYHLQLRCYVAIELKTTSFKPDYIGKLGFYLEVIDDQLRHPDDKSSIGLILCKDHEHVVAEYALRTSNRPMGISRYELPRELREALPNVEELEAELRQLDRCGNE
ncbi:MAG: DUF1016 domain-containing protein [Pseudomonadota bacterium]